MFDLIIRNANLPDGRQGFDIGIAGGKITAIEKTLPAASGEELDATGRLVSPPFCDPHFHMDATLSLGMPRMNVSGTLLEGIALWGELRPLLTKEALVDRALRYCDMAVSQGLLFIRSHVDTSDPRLVTAEALIEVRERVAPYITLQLVAFPQDGYYPRAEGVASLERALDMASTSSAVFRILNAPWRTVRGPWKHCAGLRLNAACRSISIATRPTIRCRATSSRWRHRPSALACRAGGGIAPDLDAFHGQLLRLQAHPADGRAEINVIPNPLINIMLQGRHDTYPKRRGLTRVRELMAAG